ncbi:MULTISPECIES: glycosyltransferase [unclassified Curtobacterium]|uniref:glycosyltransferase n=1 Tax=unclassified Curtobacterium TaxID=257496 RepID=UPI00226B6C0A|nr:MULTISPECIES: glycosyltransferase [unclassified Curtobacterium]
MDVDLTARDHRPVVAFVTHSAELSGAELFILRIAGATRRVRPLVVLGEHGPIEAALRAAGVEHVVIPLTETVASHTEQTGGGVRDALGKVSGAAATAVRLAGLLRRHEVALVTTHSAKAHVYGALAGRLARVPVVAHAHSVVGKEDDTSWNARLLRVVFAVLPHGRVANSRATAASLLPPRRRTTRTSDAAVVRCPVSLPDRVADAPARTLFVLAGRVSETKGQDVALRAFALARAAGIDPDARLRIVGEALFDRDRAFAAALPALAVELGIADAVDFIGHVDGVAQEFAAASVALHASPVAEGFGQVVIEAMASGRPVIASAAGAPGEMIVDGVDGFLVAPGDAAAMADAMLRLASDPELRARVGAAARVSAERYRLDRVVEDWEQAVTPHLR